MNDAIDTQLVAAPEATGKSSSNLIAVGIGAVVLAVGVGIGFVTGTKRGVKKGEDQAKKDLKNEIDRLNELVKNAAAPVTEAK